MVDDIPGAVKPAFIRGSGDSANDAGKMLNTGLYSYVYNFQVYEVSTDVCTWYTVYKLYIYIYIYIYIEMYNTLLYMHDYYQRKVINNLLMRFKKTNI